MTLYIALKNSNKYRKTIDSICQKAGVIDYYIIDPAHDDIERGFQYLLRFGEDCPEIDAGKSWKVPHYPDPTLDVKLKQDIMKAFHHIRDVMLDEKDKTTVDKNDLPVIKDLDAFVESYKGSVVELRLEDKRLIGIYPDNQRLQGKYDIEYHVSTVVNMIRIKDIFNPVKIQIKEV